MKSASRSTRTPRRDSPRLFDGFRRDHRRVLDLLAVTEREAFTGPRTLAPSAETHLAALVVRLRLQFSTHMTAEDALLYPLLGDLLPEARVTLAPLAEDHVELRCLLASLAESLARRPGAARDEQVAVQLRDLIDLLRLHIHREETAVFEMAERILDPAAARDLAGRLAEFVSVLSPNPEPAARRDRATGHGSERKS